ncbi:hypothetical protein BSP239C_03877 [Brevibacterium sp. 239c]|uniref:hypothetical protein n=1 Tax=Brevibacterium sp. 239c TaxID=1965356 RepID=UPI000C359DF3|nr:hypothetical protein [Brevibacterium sp. 239c]SMY04529.1 hypothetical protein BSP239C_03877 [Brevibacterium sp. 239c]
MSMIATDREILTPAQLADELCVTTGHLAQLRFTGQGPRFMKLGTDAKKGDSVSVMLREQLAL